MTNLVIVAQRRADRVARNVARADRRIDPLVLDPVSDDEPLDDLPGPPGPAEQGLDELDILHALPRDTFRAVIKLAMGKDPVATGPDVVTAKSAVFFKVVDEKLEPSTGRAYEIADSVWQLAQSGVHIILPALTTGSLKLLTTNPGAVKTSKGLDGVGSKKVLLDQSMFGREEDLPENLWHEAWHNLDAVFKAICEPAIYDYFKEHWSFCSSQENFSQNYKAILAFDCYVRQTYVHTRIRLSEASYATKFGECKIEDMLARVNRSLLANRSAPTATSSRFEPYAGSRESCGDKPFPRGTRNASPNTLCLICARKGHVGSACSASITEKGGKVVSCWANGRLLLIASRAEICIAFNLRADGCKRGADSHSLHICSLCGAKHGAVSGRCS